VNVYSLMLLCLLMIKKESNIGERKKYSECGRQHL
jgi:hypothetical protein